MSVENLIGSATASASPVTRVDTIQANPLGFRQWGDQGGEFIYLQGIASTIVGAWVVYGQVTATPFLTALAVHTTANTGPVAVAMAAVLASQFGWYQIGGVAQGAIINDNPYAFAANHYVYLTSTAGLVDDVVVAADIVYGACSMSVGATSPMAFLLARPFVLGIQPA